MRMMIDIMTYHNQLHMLENIPSSFSESSPVEDSSFEVGFPETSGTASSVKSNSRMRFVKFGILSNTICLV